MSNCTCIPPYQGCFVCDSSSISKIFKEELFKNSSKAVEKKEGIKHDQEKPDLSLLSPIAINKVAQVMTYGKKKYSANNWRGGIVYSRLLAATLRHVFAYLGGESKDQETGISHLAHAICDLMMVLEFEDTKPHLDDRYKQNENL